MSNLSTNENDRRLEQIVAYLDGELSPAEAALVERQLAEDADFRLELQGIERAWTALDALPTTKVDDRFSQTTMELVVGAARENVLQKTRALPIQRRKNILSKVLLATATAVLGLLAVRLIRENPNRLLLADLPTIQYIDIYSQFREIDFLEKLDNELDDGLRVAALSDDALAAEQAEFDTVAAADQRHGWITSLDDEARALLRARYNRFLALSTAEQQRLRNLHASLMAAPNSAELQRTMLQYREWLSALPASRQYELRDMPVDERVREIAAQQRREANNPWIKLSAEEVARLERVKRSIRDQIAVDWRPPERSEDGDRRGRDGRERGPYFVRQLMRQVQAHRDEWLPEILAALSDEHRGKFNALEPWQQQQQLVYWLMQARDRNSGRRGRGPFAEVTQQELEEFFAADTNPADKERLLALPREEMEWELRRMYFRNALGEDFGPGDGPFGQPPRGGRRGPGGPRDRDNFQRPPFDGPPQGGGPNFGPPPPRRDEAF